jgi:lysophospholipase L1-like esterase
MNKTKLAIPVLLLIMLAVLSLSVWFLAAESGSVRVACVGDSITRGSSYVHDLDGLLGLRYSVKNFGVGLASVSLATAKPYMNQPEFGAAKSFRPNIVVIMLGTNDAITWYQGSIGNFTVDYKQLISEFQALPGKPAVYLVVPPPIFSDSLGPNSTILEQQIVPQIHQIANQTGLPLIDFHKEMTEHPEFFSDGVHPTSEGSEFIAEKVFETIKGL